METGKMKMKKKKKKESLVSKRRRDETELGKDRLSLLSDDLIHHIMSFLNTKYAVQTCVLSTRWLSLWKSLPYLNFDVNTAPFGDNDDSNVASFSTFIARVMSTRSARANLITVRFNSSGLTLHSQVLESLLGKALLYNVQQLDIRSFCPNRIQFPLSLPFKLLTSLKLESLGGQGFNLMNLHLPGLKCLTLVWFCVRNQDFCPKIVSNWPNLESLRFVDNFFYGLESLNIHAPSLKLLEISFTCNGIFYPPGFKVVIDAPKLVDFKFDGYSPMSFSSYHHHFALLDQVYFDLKSDNDQDHDLCLVNSFKEFRHVQHLTISLQTIKALCKLPELLNEISQLQFANLKCLKLIVRGQCKDLVIPTSLLRSFKSSPLLKICW